MEEQDHDNYDNHDDDGGKTLLNDLLKENLTALHKATIDKRDQFMLNTTMNYTSIEFLKRFQRH